MYKQQLFFRTEYVKPSTAETRNLEARVDAASCACEKMAPKEREAYLATNGVSAQAKDYSTKYTDAIIKSAAPGIEKKELEMIKGAMPLDPLVRVGLLFALNKDNFNELTRNEFLDSIRSKDPAIAGAHLYAIRLTGNAVALTDPKLLSDGISHFLSGMGAGGASNLFFSVGTTGSVDALTDRKLIQNQHARNMSKDARFASELFYLIAQNPDKIGAVLDSMEWLNGLGIQKASRALSEAWVTRNFDNLTSHKFNDTGVLSGVVRGNDGNVAEKPTLLIVKTGDDGHNRAPLLIAQSGVAAGCRVIFMEDPRSHEDIANAAISSRAVAVIFSLSDHLHQQMVASTLSLMDARGFGSTQFIGGGAIRPMTGVKVLSQVGDVVPFLNLSMMSRQQPLALVTARGGGLTLKAAPIGVHGGAGMPASVSIGPNVTPSRVGQGFASISSPYSEEKRKKKKPLASVGAERRTPKRMIDPEKVAAIANVQEKARATTSNRADSVRTSVEAAIGIRAATVRAPLQVAILSSYGAGLSFGTVDMGGTVLLILPSGPAATRPIEPGTRARAGAGGSIGVSTDAKAGIAVFAPQARYMKESNRISQSAVPVPMLSSAAPAEAHANAMAHLSIRSTQFSYPGPFSSKKEHAKTIRGGSGGIPAPLLPSRGQSAATWQQHSARPGTLREKRLNPSSPLIQFMGILGNVAESFRRFNAARKERSLERLLVRSRDFGARLEGEAKRLGIDLGGIKTGSYYEVLGIKYTEDPKEIRDAYVELVKKYHPDVSREIDAAEMTKRINEVYAVLKDERLKSEYDQSSRKGSSVMGADMAKGVSRELVRRYMEVRAGDFKEFERTVSVPLQADALSAAVEEVCDWNNRFNRVTNATFGNFRTYGKRVRKLGSVNRRLLQREAGEVTLNRLRENGRRLDALLVAYDEIGGGIAIVTDNVRKEIGAQEGEIARKLRASVR